MSTSRLPSTGIGLPARPSAATVSDTATATPLEPKPKPKYVRIITERRREQCRSSQKKYRRKLLKDAQDLEIAVQHLRLEVLQHEDRRRTLYESVSSHESCVHVLEELCRVFRRGVNRGDAVSNEAQLAFVATHLHPNVGVGDWLGRDVLWDQMRRFSTYFDGTLIEMLRCWDFGVAETTTSVKMTGRLVLTVSDSTLQHVFPHLHHSSRRGLRNKLIGLQLDLKTCGCFVFDNTGRIIEMDWVIDFVDALHRVLTIEETAVVLGQARMIRSSYLLGRIRRRHGIEDYEDRTEEKAHSQKRREPRWYESGSWNESHQPRVEIRRASEATNNANDGDHGFLIHDGKGDDFVMV